ncbi:type IV toxin-antitoxin system AbiEi family antitoxin domain-containing protein [Streptomyces sp. NPDC102360]|uniref:type IV toxin-antitoxin system AbiEi family antitoxin domain-containing protein n=1 Tax=Streptomyces sp. NPDC102360 TaxID=3366160 RepID=UPI003822E479
MRSAAFGKLSELSRYQWGLVTSRQAVAEGVARWELHRLVADGALESVAFGVYQVAGAPPARYLGLRVAWLQLAPGVAAEDRGTADGVVSHRSAAVLYGVGDFEPEPYEFTVPARRRTRRTDVALRVAALAEGEVEWRDELPVVRPARLVADLLAARHDGQHIGQVIVDLLGRRLVSRARLARAADAHAAAYGLPDADGAALLDHLCGQVAPTAGRLPGRGQRGGSV